MGKGPEGGLQQAGHTERESYVEVPAWILTAGPHLPPFLPTPPPYPLSNVYEQVFRNKATRKVPAAKQF